MPVFGNRLGAASTGNNPDYFPLGSHPKVAIETIKWLSARAGHQSWIVNAKILESSNPAVVGQCFGWVQKFDERNPDNLRMADGAVKGFLSALLGVQPDDDAALIAKLGLAPDTTKDVLGALLDQVAEKAISAANPFRGTVVALTCSNKRTKKGTDFTIHDWRPVAAAAS